MLPKLLEDVARQPRTLRDDELDAATRDLLGEIRDDERVANVSVLVIELGRDNGQLIARARATLRNGEVCEAHMFTPVDAVWALALDHRLRIPQRPRVPRRRRLT